MSTKVSATAAPARAKVSAGPSPADIALRVLVAILVGYGLSYGLTAAAAALLVRGAGLSRVDAALVSTNLALLAYPTLFIAAFAVRRIAILALAATLASLALGALGWSLRL
ncbi:hypothetical protein [Caulobacter sp. RHG1]|uniref:hypothetical protein n=1 Tax=Caulobacter sp. (strain RHG1) TaxID=2545762 RepID=UPI001551E74B|nr:hypothetical protein [Caulobacter sp. RHG1]NQE61480.1 hypothetical protein [Caulobacter sp. RHG1]